MKSILALTLLALSAVQTTFAYPSIDAAIAHMPASKRAGAARYIYDTEAYKKAKRDLSLPPPLNITGVKLIPDKDHPFIKPGPNDKRGPCPGMNLLANHGYIPRNGVITLKDSIYGCQEAFNLEYEVGLIFSFVGMFTGGNIEAQMYSIGGPSDIVPPMTGQNGTVLLKGLGMGNSHARFEGDVSLTRLDLAVKNDSSSFNQGIYDDFVKHVNKYGGGRFNQKAISEYRYTRWKISNATNPKLDFTPLEVFVNGGASSLFYVCYKNVTEQKTLWVSKENMAYFMGAYEHKYEQFPPNWYRSTNCPLELIVGQAHSNYMEHPVDFKSGLLYGVYSPTTTLHDFACYTLNYLVDQITPRGTTELDQRIGAILGAWGPVLGAIFAKKFGCS